MRIGMALVIGFTYWDKDSLQKVWVPGVWSSNGVKSFWLLGTMNTVSVIPFPYL